MTAPKEPSLDAQGQGEPCDWLELQNVDRSGIGGAARYQGTGDHNHGITLGSQT